MNGIRRIAKPAVAAFTLVELSIVLVILGLLVGGVLTGQTLIHAAELRSVTTQEQRYVAAVQTFRDKYFALPGDMVNATNYWGSAGGTGLETDSNCYIVASTTTATCNGNGNGQINVTYEFYGNETYRFWQQLANAGLIEGSYTGTADTSPCCVSADNIPKSRINTGYFTAAYVGTVTGGVFPYDSIANAAFDGQYGNIFNLAAFMTGHTAAGALLKPEDAYNIDTKMDDGKPATGNVVFHGYNSSGGSIMASCTDASSSTTLSANYLLTNTAAACGIAFRNAF